MFPASARFGSVAGIDIHVDASLLIIFTLVLVALGAGVFPAWHPEWEPVVVWLTAFAAAVLFFLSILVHELSHALVGRAQGMEIRRITWRTWSASRTRGAASLGWRSSVRS